MINVTSPPVLSGQRFFSSAQHEQVAAVFEAIWPGGEDSPSARDAGAADYLDLLLGSPDSVYYEIPNWRLLYTTGLAMLDAAVRVRSGLAKPLASLSVAELTPLLMALNASGWSGFPQGFFSTLRAHCIEGCLADPRWGGNQLGIIWKWMGYPNGQAQDFQRSAAPPPPEGGRK
jgi:gluconate 2-dehydrogenase gamma chain